MRAAGPFSPLHAPPDKRLAEGILLRLGGHAASRGPVGDAALVRQVLSRALERLESRAPLPASQCPAVRCGLQRPEELVRWALGRCRRAVVRRRRAGVRVPLCAGVVDQIQVRACSCPMRPPCRGSSPALLCPFMQPCHATHPGRFWTCCQRHAATRMLHWTAGKRPRSSPSHCLSRWRLHGPSLGPTRSSRNHLRSCSLTWVCSSWSSHHLSLKRRRILQTRSSAWALRGCRSSWWPQSCLRLHRHSSRCHRLPRHRARAQLTWRACSRCAPSAWHGCSAASRPALLQQELNATRSRGRRQEGPAAPGELLIKMACAQVPACVRHARGLLIVMTRHTCLHGALVPADAAHGPMYVIGPSSNALTHARLNDPRGGIASDAAPCMKDVAAAAAARGARTAAAVRGAAARASAAADWHAAAEAEARRRREEARCQRLSALRNSDMDAYKAMLSETRNGRLNEVGCGRVTWFASRRLSLLGIVAAHVAGRALRS